MGVAREGGASGPRSHIHLVTGVYFLHGEEPLDLFEVTKFVPAF